MCKWNEDWRICSSCNEHKPWSEYHLDKHWVNGRRARCKSCYSTVRKNRINLYKAFAQFELSIENHLDAVERNQKLSDDLTKLKQGLSCIEAKRRRIEKMDDIIYYLFIVLWFVIIFTGMWMVITQ